MALSRLPKEIALNGGMDIKQSIEMQADTSLRAVTNLRWNALGELEKRPTYASSATPAVPSGADYTDATPEALFTRGTEVFALTKDLGVCVVDPADPDAVLWARRDVNVTSTVADTVVKYAPRACRVSRRFLERAQFGKNQTYIYQVASAVYEDALVIAWIEVNQTSARLKMKAVDVNTGAVLSTVQHTTATGSSYCVAAIPYLVTGSEGVLITVSSGVVAPFTVTAYTYNATTREFASAGTLTSNAKYVEHTLAGDLTASASWKFYLGFCDNTTSKLVAQYRTTSAVTTTHSGLTVTDVLSCAIAVHASAVLIVTATAHDAYAEVFGSPAGQTLIFSQPAELFLGVAVSLEDVANRKAVMYVNAYGSSDPTTYSVRMCSVDFSATSPVSNFSGVAPSAWLANSAVSLGSRSYVSVMLEPHTGENTTALLCRYYEDATNNIARLEPVARLGHDRYYSRDAAFAGGHLSSTVVDNKAHLVFTADASEDDVVLATRGAQSIFHATVAFAADGEALPLQSVERDGSTMIASGLMLEWDGETLTEHAPITRPRISVEVYTAFGSGGTLSKSGTTMTFFDGDANFPADMVGRTILFAGATSGGNNGGFVVTDRVDDNTVKFTNAAGVAEVHAGTWATDATNVATGGVFSLTAIYRWVDARGNLHESAPAEAFESADLASNCEFRVYVSKPPFYAMDGVVTQELTPEVYITAADGTEYYLANDEDSVKRFDGTSDISSYWWIFDGLGAGVVGDSPLYTNGGEIVAEPPPALVGPCRLADRIWAIDAEDRARIWFTKPLVAGFAPQWSTDNTLTIGDEGLAIADVNGLPTIFAARGVWQVNGSGPDANGVGDFLPALRLPLEVQCIDPLICRTNVGVLFRGRRGFYVLGEGVQPIGLPIDPGTRAPTSSDYAYARAVFDEAHNEIRVADAQTGRYFVFNTLEKRWSEWTQSASAQNVLDMVTCDGRVWYLHGGGSSASIRREYGVDEPGYNTSTEAWSIETPWIRLDGAIGDGRVWRAWLAIKGAASMANVSSLVAQYETRSSTQDNGTDTFTWTGAQLSALGGLDDAIALEMHPAHQRAKAFRLTVTETPSSAHAGSKPVSLRLDLGVDGKAMRRLPSGALKGAT